MRDELVEQLSVRVVGYKDGVQNCLGLLQLDYEGQHVFYAEDVKVENILRFFPILNADLVQIVLFIDSLP